MAEKNYNNILNYYGYPDFGNAYIKKPEYVDQEALDAEINKVVGNAPSDLDTLEELANAVTSGGGIDLTEINEKIDSKADKETVDTKFEEIETAMADKADASDLDNLATKADLEEVTERVQDILRDAPEELDTLKEIAELLDKKQNADEVVDALSTKLNTDEFTAHVEANADAFSAINETLEEKADKTQLEGLASTDYVDTKVNEITVPENLSELNNDANYVQDENYVHTDNNFTTELKEKLDGLSNYDDTELSGKVDALENAGYITMTDVEDKGYTTMEAVEEKGYSTFDGNYSSLIGAPAIPVVPTDVSEFTNDAGYLTTTTADERYYDKTTTDSIFIAKSQYEDDMELKANKAELDDYATDGDLASAVRELVVRLNKLEAQNAVLVEKATDSAEDINNMTTEEAAAADVVVATDEAIASLQTPKTFNSISVAGGEVGGQDVINLLATESIDVNGLTVSGQKGTGNGKIIFGSKDVTISNLNIEPGCTVYNVFEGKQDKVEENLVENFTATNIVVNDTDLKHNVFNIYQLKDGANILVKDSVFNLDVANSNIMRVMPRTSPSRLKTLIGTMRIRHILTPTLLGLAF